jgi:AcrR family transcriptional regulator
MTSADIARTGRARPLPPEERRAAIIAATIPLLTELGPEVTTRQIAAASGIAEGTIFRVFTDKEQLVGDCVATVMDPAPLVEELSAVDPALPLDERLLAVVRIMQRRLILVISLMIAVRMGRSASTGDHDKHRKNNERTNELVYAAVAQLLEPDAAAFRMPVRQVVRMVRLLTFSGSHRMIADGELLTPEDIVTVLLDGVRRRETES